MESSSGERGNWAGRIKGVPKTASAGERLVASWDECPANLWILPTFSAPQNMTRDDLTSPVAAAATSQVKLCPYDEEEPHLSSRLLPQCVF